MSKLPGFDLVPIGPEGNGRHRKKAKRIQPVLPKLKKFEACAALVEIRSKLEEELQQSAEFLEKERGGEGMKDWWEKDCQRLVRWLAAIDMAGAAMTR